MKIVGNSPSVISVLKDSTHSIHVRMNQSNECLRYFVLEKRSTRISIQEASRNLHTFRHVIISFNRVPTWCDLNTWFSRVPIIRISVFFFQRITERDFLEFRGSESNEPNYYPTSRTLFWGISGDTSTRPNEDLFAYSRLVFLIHGLVLNEELELHLENLDFFAFHLFYFYILYNLRIIYFLE